MWKVTQRLTIDEHDYVFEFDRHDEAYLFARRFACARGALFVNVHSPSGKLAHEWKREDNIWRAHIPVLEQYGVNTV